MKLAVISIITPVYNGLPYIKECIESVLSQDYEDWEMIITDNCSTDGTVDYLKTIRDSRIKIFYQEENLGIFGNLNFAFTQATATISQILCADDYFYKKDSLGLVVAYWGKAEPGVGFCRFNLGDPFQIKVFPPVVKHTDSEMLFFIFGNIPGNLSNISLRTHIVKNIGWFNPKLPYAGDFDFWVRAAREFDMGIEKKSISYVRRHPGVASNYLNSKGELLNQKVIIINKLFKNISTVHPNSALLLKLHGTLCFDSIERSNAYVSYYKGNRFYLNELNLVQANAMFCFKNKVIRQLIFIISMGGRLGRSLTALRLLRLIKIN
jgi:glycosyltransferase involved in cell wall biosynthesis